MAKSNSQAKSDGHKEHVVFEKHWPEGYETYVHYGKIRPVNPPSVFSDIPDSCVPSVIKRSQTRTSTEENIGVQLDELGEFNIQDKLDYNRIDDLKWSDCLG